MLTVNVAHLEVFSELADLKLLAIKVNRPIILS